LIRFHKKKHPEKMGADEVNDWLSHLANNRNLAINTHKTVFLKASPLIKISPVDRAYVTTGKDYGCAQSNLAR
jgi:hypothetical protein